MENSEDATAQRLVKTIEGAISELGGSIEVSGPVDLGESIDFNEAIDLGVPIEFSVALNLDELFDPLPPTGLPGSMGLSIHESVADVPKFTSCEEVIQGRLTSRREECPLVLGPAGENLTSAGHPKSPWEPLLPYVPTIVRLDRRKQGLIVSLEESLRGLAQSLGADPSVVPPFPADLQVRSPRSSSTSSSSSSSGDSSHRSSSSSSRNTPPLDRVNAVHSEPVPEGVQDGNIATDTGEPNVATVSKSPLSRNILRTAPTSAGSETEPRLASVVTLPPPHPSNAPKLGSTHRRAIRCFDCQNFGHARQQCPNPTGEAFCYGCGRHQVTFRTCPKCSLAWVRKGPYVPRLGCNVPRAQISRLLTEDTVAAATQRPLGGVGSGPSRGRATEQREYPRWVGAWLPRHQPDCHSVKNRSRLCNCQPGSTRR